MPHIAGWPAHVPTQILHAAYIDHAHDHGDRHPATDAWLARKLGKLLPGGKPRFFRSKLGDGTRPHCYRLDHLDQCREAFLQAMKIDKHDWPEAE